jgi:ribonuclease Z
MKACYTLLNHFSQRYAKVPALSESQANVCISFDMMGVSIKQIPLLPKYNPAMQLMFKDDENEEKDNADATTTDKRARKAEQKEKKKRKLDNADEQMTV